MTASGRPIDPAVLVALVEGEAVLSRVLEVAGEGSLYLVGGSVRDALLGLGDARFDLDLAFDGPVAELALQLDPDAVLHERFDTAEIRVEGRAIDIARCRKERYPHPGALPVVEPAPIEQDLARRDFTVNALAVRVERPEDLIDPYDGRGDLERGLLRVLHSGSFIDDPTRALRAARYSARLGFDLELKTANLLREADLGQISKDRIDAELLLIADEPSAVEALRLTAAWNLLSIPDERLELTACALQRVTRPEWQSFSDRGQIVLAANNGPGPEEIADLIEYPGSPSAAVATVNGRPGIELVLARAAGAEWLERWLNDWRGVEPEVSGDDLLRAGIPAGPAIGVGLHAALVARLDTGLHGRDVQIELAVSAARKFLEEGGGS